MDAPSHDQRTLTSTGDQPPGEVALHVSPTAGQLTTDFGEYELLEELGRGGMGVVYKARQKDLERLVAVKVILAGRLATPEQVQRFYAEARAAAKVQHPNVVHIYEAGEVRGNHYFAMEYIAGQSLAHVVEARALDAEMIAELVSTVARAVAHLHAQSIVHRDLKPSNILLDQQQRPYVTDFGLAMMIERTGDTDQPVAIAGTPNYMAPEQAAGTGALIGPRTDVYCLGAVLYHLLTRRPPFVADSTVDTLVQVIENEPPLPRQLNPKILPELEMICLRCLAKNPVDRYPSAAALADDLDRLLAGEAVEVPPPGLWQQLRSWGRRQPALAARLVGLIAGAVIAQTNYQLTHAVRLGLHLEVMSVLALWCAASAICQWLLDRPRWTEIGRWAWAAADVVLFTLALHLVDGMLSPLIVGYAMLITAAGLWLRRRLVWLVTAMSVLGYIALVLDGYRNGLTLPTPHWHLIAITVLWLLGAVVAHQVNRFRKLGRYYKRQAVAGHPLEACVGHQSGQ